MSDVAAPARLEPAEMERQIRALGPWFHNIDLGGIKTAPEHFLGDYPAVKFARFAAALPADMTGKSVLDIGCNGGFYSIEMKRRGASRVVGVDSDETYLAQARFAAKMSGYDDIEFAKLSVYDVASLREQFDLVIFMGVFYHLRHPLLALDLIHAHVTKDMLLFQSMQRGSKIIAPVKTDYPITTTDIFDQPGWPKLHFIENDYSNDCTNWFVPNAAAAQALLRSSGFDIIAQPEEEVYVCRRREMDDYFPRPVYPASA
jgi:tRNA (mo5U34)-methyltransferase